MNASRLLRLALLVGSVLRLCGCETPAPPTPTPPKVVVATPVVRDVQQYANFVGETAASRTLEVRARVQGFLDKVHFEEGDFVEEGELLFEIEPEPFEAELTRLEAVVKQTEAALKLAQSNLDRGQKAFDKGAITPEDLATRVAERDAAQAKLEADKAAVRHAKIDLSYTKISAPFRGIAGRSLIDAGNLVGSGDNTLLTVVRQVQPMYVYFDISEKVIARHLNRSGGIEGERGERPKVFLQLPEQREFSQQGQVDFLDNRVDPSTGTARVRGVFSNEENLIYPGYTVNVRVPREQDRDAVLVREEAVGTDLAGKYLLIVGADKVVELRHVTLGTLTDDGLRVISEGIAPEEQYIVKGLQRARPGLACDPQPEAGEGASESATAQAERKQGDGPRGG